MSAERGERGGPARRGEQGGGLVEVMVALLILAVALIPVAAGGIYSSRALRAGQGYTKAADVAQTKLDSLRARGWVNLTPAGNGSDVVRGIPVSWTITGANPRQVRVIVQRQVLGGTRPDTFVTYVAQ